ncbi:Na(+)/H(+) antiporter subunit B [Phycisphaerales bacterium AB-hyl4]|uniref:Na(+)/H(+) antiporter subunit B n=1 Tax=Natronomicrosphaera hydrolytica TaxID=3242702 RepID=A0ABV4U827_9BACT
MVLLDLLLGLMVVLLAVAALSVRGAFAAVVLFIVYGMMVAVGWVRMGSPDVALAEAAIGAGITGALLLEAVGAVQRGNGER